MNAEFKDKLIGGAITGVITTIIYVLVEIFWLGKRRTKQIEDTAKAMLDNNQKQFDALLAQYNAHSTASKTEIVAKVDDVANKVTSKVDGIKEDVTRALENAATSNGVVVAKAVNDGMQNLAGVVTGQLEKNLEKGFDKMSEHIKDGLQDGIKKVLKDVQRQA